jgi:uncharacterized protein
MIQRTDSESVLGRDTRAGTREGRPYENCCIGVFTLRDGRIQDLREYTDTLYASEVAFTEPKARLKR